LRSIPVAKDTTAARDADTRSIAVLRFCAGDASVLQALGRDDRIVVLATASSAFAEQKAYRRAIDAYDEALALARDGIADGSPALRALAVGGNNLAAALEEEPDRDKQENRGMLVSE